MLLQAIRVTSCYINHESGVNFYTLDAGDVVVAVGPVSGTSILIWHVITQYGIAKVHVSNFKIICVTNDDVDKYNFSILKKMFDTALDCSA